MMEYGSIEDIQDRHTRAGMNAVFAAQDSEWLFKTYYNDVASLLHEIAERDALLRECLEPVGYAAEVCNTFGFGKDAEYRDIVTRIREVIGDE